MCTARTDDGVNAAGTVPNAIGGATAAFGSAPGDIRSCPMRSVDGIGDTGSFDIGSRGPGSIASVVSPKIGADSIGWSGVFFPAVMASIWPGSICCVRSDDVGSSSYVSFAMVGEDGATDAGSRGDFDVIGIENVPPDFRSVRAESSPRRA